MLSNHGVELVSIDGVFMETSYIKPCLTEKHRIERLRFILNLIKPNEKEFIDLKNRIHIDEKWFYLQVATIKRKRFEGMERHDDDTCQHKSHFTKVMFTAAIGMPGDGFDGKAAIMPLVEEHVAQRNSKNRPRGTIEWKSYSLDSQAFYECMTMENGMLEVIAEQFQNEEEIVIQMDNASPHTGDNNIEDLNAFCEDNNLPITIVTQPAQSPDLNYCDGSFFHSLQKRTYKLRAGCTNEQHLMDNVQSAWEDYPSEVINSCCSHMFSVYNAVLECFGGNQYDVPHTNTRGRKKNNHPINTVTVSPEKLAELKKTVADYDKNHK